MGSVFLVIGGLKLIDVKGFAELFATYDLIGKRSKAYCYAYPFIEIVLAFLFLFQKLIFLAAIVTLVIMVIGSISIAKHLLSGERTSCACLGAKFNIPLTRFTLVEDAVMAIMACMLLFR